MGSPFSQFHCARYICPSLTVFLPPSVSATFVLLSLITSLPSTLLLTSLYCSLAFLTLISVSHVFCAFLAFSTLRRLTPSRPQVPRSSFFCSSPCSEHPMSSGAPFSLFAILPRYSLPLPAFLLHPKIRRRSPVPLLLPRCVLPFTALSPIGLCFPFIVGSSFSTSLLLPSPLSLTFRPVFFLFPPSFAFLPRPLLSISVFYSFSYCHRSCSFFDFSTLRFIASCSYLPFFWLNQTCEDKIPASKVKLI